MSSPTRQPLRDTTPEAEAVQLHCYREMSVERKLALVEDANRTARRLASNGLASRFPEASQEAFTSGSCT